jgi:hypothetical protein
VGGVIFFGKKHKTSAMPKRVPQAIGDEDRNYVDSLVHALWHATDGVASTDAQREKNLERACAILSELIVLSKIPAFDDTTRKDRVDFAFAYLRNDIRRAADHMNRFCRALGCHSRLWIDAAGRLGFTGSGIEEDPRVTAEAWA